MVKSIIFGNTVIFVFLSNMKNVIMPKLWLMCFSLRINLLRTFTASDYTFGICKPFLKFLDVLLQPHPNQSNTRVSE